MSHVPSSARGRWRTAPFTDGRTPGTRRGITKGRHGRGRSGFRRGGCGYRSGVHAPSRFRTETASKAAPGPDPVRLARVSRFDTPGHWCCAPAIDEAGDQCSLGNGQPAWAASTGDIATRPSPVRPGGAFFSTPRERKPRDGRSRTGPGFGVGLQCCKGGTRRAAACSLAHNLAATTSKRRDAPDLRLTGIAAAAPATELAALFDADISSVDGKIPAAMTLWSWSQFSARGSTMSAMRT